MPVASPGYYRMLRREREARELALIEEQWRRDLAAHREHWLARTTSVDAWAERTVRAWFERHDDIDAAVARGCADGGPYR